MRRTIEGVFVSLNTRVFEQTTPMEATREEGLALEGGFLAL